MDQRSIEKHLRRWHRRDKTACDDLPRDAHNAKASDGRGHSAMTESGLSVEDQIRKEWDPARAGGLPVFFALASGDD